MLVQIPKFNSNKKQKKTVFFLLPLNYKSNDIKYKCTLDTRACVCVCILRIRTRYTFKNDAKTYDSYNSYAVTIIMTKSKTQIDVNNNR